MQDELRPEITDNEIRRLLGLPPLRSSQVEPAPVSAEAPPEPSTELAPVSAPSDPTGQVQRTQPGEEFQLSPFMQGVQDTGEPIVPPEGFPSAATRQFGRGARTTGEVALETQGALAELGTRGSEFAGADPTGLSQIVQLAGGDVNFQPDPTAFQGIPTDVTQPRDFLQTLEQQNRARPFLQELAGGLIFDPLNLVPGLGFVDDPLRGGLRFRNAPQTLLSDAPASALGRGIREAPTALPAQVQGPAPSARAGIFGQAAPPPQVIDDIPTQSSAIPDTPLETAYRELDEAFANLEAESIPGSRAPRFGTPERSAFDAQRRGLASEGRGVPPKRIRIQEARGRLAAAQEQVLQQEAIQSQRQLAFKDRIDFSSLREVSDRRLFGILDDAGASSIGPNGELLEGGLSEVLDEFRRFLQDPSTADNWRETLLLRSQARAARAARSSEILDTLIEQGMPVEEALRISREALAGPLPRAGTPLHQLAAPQVREALFQEVYTQLAGDRFELESTATALANALATGSVPRTPGARGGSAFTRLSRVFGEDLTRTLGQRRSLEEIIALDTRGNLGLTGFQGRPPRPAQLGTQEFGAARQIGGRQTFGQVPTERLLPDEPILTGQQVPDALAQPPGPFQEKLPDLRTQGQKDIDLQIYREALGDAPPPTGPRDPRARALMDLPPDDVVRQPAMLGALDKSRMLAWAKVAGLNVMDFGNLIRANMATLDVSYLRQQKFLLANHPGDFIKSFPRAIRSLWSEQYAGQIDNMILSDPDYQIYSRLKLDFLRPLSARDSTAYKAAQEFIILAGDRPLQRFANKLPWLRISERSFVTGTNYMNWRIFKGYLKGLRRIEDQVASGGVKLKPGEYWDTLEHANKMGRHLENMTGRGRLPERLESLAPVANSMFFSLRLNLGRLFSFGDLFSNNRFVRKEAWRNFSTSIAAMGGVILGGEQLGWWDVEKDSRSSDFMKIRIGNLRIDPWGGFQQYAVLYSRLLPLVGGIKSASTGDVSDYDPVEGIARFARTKAAPLINDALILWTARDFSGKEVDRTNALFWLERHAPLSAQDVLEVFDEFGLVGLTATPLALTGEGMQVHDQTFERVSQDRYDTSYSDLPDEIRELVRNEFRDILPQEEAAKAEEEEELRKQQDSEFEAERSRNFYDKFPNLSRPEPSQSERRNAIAEELFPGKGLYSELPEREREQVRREERRRVSPTQLRQERLDALRRSQELEEERRRSFEGEDSSGRSRRELQTPGLRRGANPRGR